MLRDWVGCGTFSVVVSVLLTVFMILVRPVLLRVCIRSIYSRVSDFYRIAQRSNENLIAKCTQTWVHCVELDFRWILVLVLYFSEVVWINYEFLKFNSSLKMEKGWINPGLTRVTLWLVHVACWRQHGVIILALSWQVGVLLTSAWRHQRHHSDRWG